jgi:hypothetical protein
MMIMDEGTFNLVQQQQHSHHVPSPWHLAMHGLSMNGTNLRSMDGTEETAPAKTKNKDVD